MLRGILGIDHLLQGEEDREKFIHGILGRELFLPETDG
jgi:hypothetical protein